MKKFPQFVFIFLPLFVSLFLFPSIVKADTIDLEINTSVLDYDNEAYQTLKQHTLDYINNNSDANYYIIYYDSSERQVNGKYTNIIDTSKINARITGSLPFVYLIYYAEDTSICNRINFTFNPNRGITGFQINTSTLTITTTNNLLGFDQYYCSDNILNYVIIDTNITSNLNYNNTNSIFNLDNRGTIAVGSSIPTLVEMYPSVPSDNTPLLTQFFDISIEKLQLICDFITSSYVYLSIIVIFIIYFTILLIRRLK